MTVPLPPGSVPPPPNALAPADSSEMGAGRERPLSVPAVASLICGILFCIPILTGVLAVLLGIGGIFQTGETKKRGRWMAVVGLLLGIASVGIWTLGGGAALIAYVYNQTHSETADAQGAITATNDFLRAISDNNEDAIQKHNGSLDEKGLTAFRAYCNRQGKFTGTSVNASVSNGTADLSGTAQYEMRNQNLKAQLTYTDSIWKVTSINLAPIEQAADNDRPPAPGPSGGENLPPARGPRGGGNEELPTPTPAPTPAPMPAPAPAPQQPLTNGAVMATQEFIRGLCEGDDNLVAKHDGGFSRETRQQFTDYFKPLGKLTAADLSGETGPENTTVTGTAVFENGKQSVKATLVLKDAEWKVVTIDVEPLR